jgi:transketolase
LAQKLRGQPSWVYLFTGDGELDEGQCWEGALFTPHMKIDNLIWFVDYNKKQLDGATEEVLGLGDIVGKFKSFGWHVQDIDGSDTAAIKTAIDAAKAVKDIPSCIVLNTIKGAGIPCVASIELNHHIQLEGELLEKAMKEARDAVADANNSAAL